MNEIEELLDYYVIQEKNKFCQECSKGTVKLEATLHIGTGRHSADFLIGRQETMYVIKNIIRFIDAVKFQQMAVYGHGLAFIHSQGTFERDSLPLVKLLMDIYMNQLYMYGENASCCKDDKSMLLLNYENFDALINLYEGKKLRIERNLNICEYEVIKSNPQLGIRIELDNKKPGINIIMDDFIWTEGVGRGYIISNDSLYICDGEFYNDMREFMRIIGREGITSCFISESSYCTFADTLLPVIRKYSEVESCINFDEYHPEHPEFSVYLDCQKKSSKAADSIITARLEAIYGEKVHNPIKNIAPDELYRNVQEEFRMKTMVEAYLPKMTSDKEMYYLEHDDDKLLLLIEEGVAQLREMADVYVTDAFRKIKIISGKKISVGVSINSGLLEVTWDVDGMSIQEVNAILESYRLKKTYHRLKNGDFIELDNDGLMVLSKLKENLMITDSQMASGKAELPLYRAMYIDSLLNNNYDRLSIRKNDNFIKMTDQIASYSDSEYKVPTTINASLRGYQETGYRWMCTLAKLGFGGILADDMGLGKTLQMLTFLSACRGGTSLVVCPASLVYNWENECRRFVPDMKVRTLVGSAEEREQIIAEYDKYDIVITSYDLLKRDIELFDGKHFAYQIIDEAQYIKNASTQAARVVKSINSGCRFALTGTPIENRLSELWSIFEYLMPGYLFGYKHFKEEFEVKIVQMEDSDALTELHNMIKPFIMRRLKRDVLKDLPDKLEEVIYSGMGEEQEKLYKVYEKQLISSLNSKTDKEISTGKIEILSQLTRMRQICCDPALVYDDYKGGSAKFDMCIELVTNAVNAEHKLLIFSQFAKMLARLDRRLNKEGIRTYMLTGDTSKSDRNMMVENFQNGEADVFLISLKAGGTGLNLTAADLVVHYDPWWNIAAQNQASDRAHRIGQNNRVSVFKLIARGTVEERILQLQVQKKELADQIISESGISVSSLSRNDLLALFE